MISTLWVMLGIRENSSNLSNNMTLELWPTLNFLKKHFRTNIHVKISDSYRYYMLNLVLEILTFRLGYKVSNEYKAEYISILFLCIEKCILHSNILYFFLLIDNFMNWPEDSQLFEKKPRLKFEICKVFYIWISGVSIQVKKRYFSILRSNDTLSIYKKKEFKCQVSVLPFEFCSDFKAGLNSA